jgi:hypothetical protein
MPYIDQYKNPKRNGEWKRLGDFYVDTKYNADSHKKNIIHTLASLHISDANIKISFR